MLGIQNWYFCRAAVVFHTGTLIGSEEAQNPRLLKTAEEPISHISCSGISRE